MSCWYFLAKHNHRSSDERTLAGFENVIVLSDEFFQEVTQHPIPADLEVVKLLSSAPAVRRLVQRVKLEIHSIRVNENMMGELDEGVWK